MGIEIGDRFGQAIAETIKSRKIRKVIETGTHKGTGSTKIIAKALSDISPKYKLLTMEANGDYANEAHRNLSMFHGVQVWNGLSIPRELLPSLADVEKYVDECRKNFPGVHVDHECLSSYIDETGVACPHQDMLGFFLPMYPWGMIVLDSAGHIGFQEFMRAMEFVKYNTIFVLDDTRHIKHCRTLSEMKKDARFNVIAEFEERYGAAIVEFNYADS